MVVPKHIGRDCELSTTGLDPRGETIDPFDVTRAVLDEIDAAFTPLGTATWHAHSQWSSAGQWSGGYGSYGRGSAQSSDCLRHWGPSGGCYYADMSHFEAASPLALSPKAYAAQCLALLEVAEAARRRAEERARPGTRYSLSTANADLTEPGISWGSHTNVAVAPSLWDELFNDPRRPAVMGYVTSAIAAAIAFFGSGYLLPFNDGTTVYSLSGRAHHLSLVRSYSTTEPYRRGLLNARREPHGEGQDRLHLIGFDFSPLSAGLHGSFLQCLLAGAELGYCGHNLYDPVRALRIWSWGLDQRSGKLPQTALLVDGRQLTLPAYIAELSGKLLALCEQGLIGEDVAPGARELLPMVIELAHYAEEGSLNRCAKHLDWAAKLLYLLDLCQGGAELGDATTRLADHDFCNTDPSRGPFWQLWDVGLVDPLVSRADVEACLVDGPADCRGWVRGRLIQRFGPQITNVNWSYVELRRDDWRWGPRLRVEMPRPDWPNRAIFESILERATSVEDLAELLRTVGDGAIRQSDPLLDISGQLASAIEPPGNGRSAKK